MVSRIKNWCHNRYNIRKKAVYKKYTIKIVLLFCTFIFSGCAVSESAVSESEMASESESIPESENSVVESGIYEDIVPILNDYVTEKVKKRMSWYHDGDIQASDVVIDEIYYGSFTQEKAREILVICNILNTPHVAGMNNKVGLLLDETTLDVISYQLIRGDSVEISCLQTDRGVNRILVSTAAINQGVITSYIRLFAIEKNEWTELPIDALESMREGYYYFIGNDFILVSSEAKLASIENGSDVKPTLTDSGKIVEVLTWNTATEQFETAAVEESTEVSSEETVPNGVISSEQIGEGYHSWQEAYLDYLENHADSYPENSEVNLLYLDGDEIPELLINTKVAAGGEQILSFYEGNLSRLYLLDIASVFKEKKGLINNGWGKMGYYPTYIYQLYQGQFYKLLDGLIWGGEGDYVGVYFYEIEGETVTEEEFNDAVEEVFGSEDGTRPEYCYSVDEMKTLLRTGHDSSYAHLYELVVEDITWEEARTICHGKGGYLAAITTPEEILAVRDIIKNEKKGEISFYVGYQSYGWYHDTWKEGWLDKLDRLTQTSSIITGFSQYADPDYDYKNSNANWDNYKPFVGLIQYNESTDRIYLYDAPSDILEASPEYTGKIGYICEYD